MVGHRIVQGHAKDHKGIGGGDDGGDGGDGGGGGGGGQLECPQNYFMS